MHCPECGFEWEQLLMYEPDQQGWKRPACKHDTTLANEVAD